MSIFNRIYGRANKAEIDRGEACHTNATDLPLDHQLTFCRDAGEWTFKDGHIYLNNEEIEGILNASTDDVRFQSAVSEALSEYKEFVRQKGNGHFEKFAARVDALQDKILSNMKRIYDQRTGGVRFVWGDGAYLLNNINVRALLALYHMRPTEKAKKFLDGLKAKLALILTNKNGSPHYERVNKAVKSLYDEVESALKEPSIDGRYLPVNNGCVNS